MRSVVQRLGLEGDFVASLPEESVGTFLRSWIRALYLTHHEDHQGDESRYREVDECSQLIRPLLAQPFDLPQALSRLPPMVEQQHRCQKEIEEERRESGELARHAVHWYESLIPQSDQVLVSDLRNTRIVLIKWIPIGSHGIPSLRSDSTLLPLLESALEDYPGIDREGSVHGVRIYVEREFQIDEYGELFITDPGLPHYRAECALLGTEDINRSSVPSSATKEYVPLNHPITPELTAAIGRGMYEKLEGHSDLTYITPYIYTGKPYETRRLYSSTVVGGMFQMCYEGIIVSVERGGIPVKPPDALFELSPSLKLSIAILKIGGESPFDPTRAQEELRALVSPQELEHALAETLRSALLKKDESDMSLLTNLCALTTRHFPAVRDNPRVCSALDLFTEYQVTKEQGRLRCEVVLTALDLDTTRIDNTIVKLSAFPSPSHSDIGRAMVLLQNVGDKKAFLSAPDIEESIGEIVSFLLETRSLSPRPHEFAGCLPVPSDILAKSLSPLQIPDEKTTARDYVTYLCAELPLLLGPELTLYLRRTGNYHQMTTFFLRSLELHEDPTYLKKCAEALDLQDTFRHDCVFDLFSRTVVKTGQVTPLIRYLWDNFPEAFESAVLNDPVFRKLRSEKKGGGT